MPDYRRNGRQVYGKVLVKGDLLVRCLLPFLLPEYPADAVVYLKFLVWNLCLWYDKSIMKMIQTEV